LEQAAVEVVGALTPVGLLDDRGDQVVADHIRVLGDLGLGGAGGRARLRPLGCVQSVPGGGVDHSASLSVSSFTSSPSDTSSALVPGSTAVISRSARSMG